MIARFFYWRSSIALLSILLASTVFISLIIWLVAFSHPLPHWDQWTFLWSYSSIQERGGSWLQFFLSQHNEHRIAVPRAFFIADLEWFGGRNISLVVANIAIQMLSWIGLCWLVWPQLHNSLNRITAMALALVVLFSAAQAENFIWGFQVQFVGVYAAGIWACICVVKNKIWLGAVMAVVATLMMANGLFIWLVLLLLSLALRKEKKSLLIYGAGFIFCLCAYLIDFKTIGGHTSAVYALTHPIEFSGYLFAYLGSSGGLGRPSLAMCVGGGAVVFFFIMTFHAWRHREAQSPRFWALWSIAVFILISASVTTLGRLSFGFVQALAGRYVTPSSVFLVSLAFAWLSLARAAASAELTGKKIIIKGGLAALLLVVLGLVFGNHVRNKEELMARHQHSDMTSDAITVGVQDSRVYDMTYNEVEVIERGADWLKSAHLSIFSRRPWSLLGASVGVDIPIAPESRCMGHIDDATPFSGKSRTGSSTLVNGWGWDTKSRRRPPHILLVDGSNRVTGFASEMIPRGDVAIAFGAPRATASGWAGYNSRGAPVAAYGLIDDQSLACKLSPLHAHI